MKSVYDLIKSLSRNGYNAMERGLYVDWKTYAQSN